MSTITLCTELTKGLDNPSEKTGIFEQVEGSKLITGDPSVSGAPSESTLITFVPPGSSPTPAAGGFNPSPPAASSGMGASFMAAFGMDSSPPGGDTSQRSAGEPSSSNSETMSTGLAGISTNAANQVTPPFTPHSYRNLK